MAFKPSQVTFTLPGKAKPVGKAGFGCRGLYRFATEQPGYYELLFLTMEHSGEERPQNAPARSSNHLRVHGGTGSGMHGQRRLETG